MKLSERLVTARTKAGLSQVELAKKIGVSPGTVAGWETDAHGIRMSHVSKVAEILHLKVKDLLADMVERSAS